MRNKRTMDFYDQTINNIRKIMKDRDIKQTTAAKFLDIDPSQFSKILKGTVQLSIRQLSIFAREMDMREIDVFTYPDVYTANGKNIDNAEVLLQMRLTKEKKDQVLKLVFGENDIEILNK